MLWMFSRAAAAVALIFACPAIASPQGNYLAEVLWQLPAGGNVFSLIESVQAEVTTDRFNSGGLNAGVPERATAFLASWSQTKYFINEALISSPIDGTPMVFPELAFWEAVMVSTMSGGLSVDLVPRQPTQRGVFEVIGSGSGLTEPSSPSRPPAIAILGNYAHINGIVTGDAVGARLTFTAGGVFTRATTFERHGQRTRDTKSAFLNWSFGDVRGLALVQQDARHVQAAYERGGLTIFGAHTARTREAPAPPAFQQADRVFDGPVPSLIEPTRREARWQTGASFSFRHARRQSVRVGAALQRSSANTDPIASVLVAERVAGVPARVWQFVSPAAQSRRRMWNATAFASDRIDLSSRMWLTAELQVDAASGSAAGGATGISWQSLLPSLEFQWESGPLAKWRFHTGVSRDADQLLLGLLAYGDPAAPIANVVRWNGENIHSLQPPLMMRVGPGTGGDPAFSAIDPKLKRPVTDQFIIGLEYLPDLAYTFRVTGLARRQSPLVNVVNIGLPISAYSIFTIPDANADWVNPADDQQLVVYERKREAFGQDQYLLTNPDVERATMGAVIVAAAINKSPVFFRIDATASASVGPGGNRGYTAIENDQSMLGELFTNPNSATYARGRLFNDRAYTIKSLATVRLPSQMTVGAIARFQDGQPFSRLAIVANLNQGAEAIQAFPRGRSRFSYRATLDLRLQKRFGRIDLIADAYNLLNASSEVEENVVTGPRFREITAVQPPRAFHLGARVTF